MQCLYVKFTRLVVNNALQCSTPGVQGAYYMDTAMLPCRDGAAPANLEVQGTASLIAGIKDPVVARKAAHVVTPAARVLNKKLFYKTAI